MPDHIILVIDENQDTIWLYEKLMLLIPSQHFQMFWARNAKEGLAFLKSQKPSVILLRFPICQFSEIFQHIQFEAGLRAIPWVIVSGNHDGLTFLTGPKSFELCQLPVTELGLKKSIQCAIAQTKKQYTLNGLELYF